MTETGIISETGKDPLIERRTKIAYLVEQKNFKGLEGFGITVISDKEGSKDTCFETALPPSLYPKDILKRIISDWEEVEEPNAHDVAIYRKASGKITHVGRATHNGRVISRWGEGGLICEHDPLDIPLFAGLNIKVTWYREPRNSNTG